MPWGVAAAVLGTAGSVASGVIGSNAAGKAAGQQVAAGNEAIGTETQALNQAKALYDPFVTGGTNAFADLQRLLGIGTPGGPTSPVLQMLGIGGPGGVGGTGSINPAQFHGDPGYQFRQQEGQNAITNSAAANGGIGGNALRALMGFGQQTANQGWQQYLGNVGNAWQQQIGNVAGVSNTGFNASGALAGDTLSTGRNIGGIQMGQGNARAAGTIGSAQALEGMIKGIVSSITQGMGGMSGGGGGSGGGFSSMFGGGGGGSNIGVGGSGTGTVPATGLPYQIGQPGDSWY